MPGWAARSSRTRSAMAFRVNSSVWPETAMSTTRNRASISVMIGFSVSSGNVSMASTLALMSSSTRRVSAPSPTSTSTVPEPSSAVDVICSMPSMPWMASSIRMQTPSSTSSGAAPRYGTWMLTMSSSISGKVSPRTLNMPIRPLTMMNTISRLAATGLRANQSIIPFMMRLPSRCAGHRPGFQGWPAAPPMRYRWVAVRRKNDPSETAIEASVSPSSWLVASSVYVVPGASTVVRPSSLWT